MACEDFPCCGHEAGDCPVEDSKGRRRWRCVGGCGRLLPVGAPSSICRGCARRMERAARDGDDYGGRDD